MLEKYGLIETSANAVKVNDKFGRLSVLAVGQKPNSYKYYAICGCSCGNVCKVRFDRLRSGGTKSCGCLHKEIITKHGLTKSGMLKRWKNMMQRCYDENNHAYPRYGGRGIKVCDRWHDVNKWAEDLLPTFKHGLELDRIDNDGDYHIDNVRWVDEKTNCNNRSSCRLITFNGKTQTATKWERELNFSQGTIYTRLSVLNWTVERALTEPVADVSENMRKVQSKRWGGHVKKVSDRPKRIVKKYEYLGRMMTIRELSEVSGVSIKLMRKRIQERGWSVEKAVRKQIH